MELRENYHGLIKRGTTCYLNSVLQVLFMTPEFRQAVSRSVEDDPNSDFIDPHLKEMFDRLLQKPTDTRKILTTLHIDKVFEQQDAAEYLEKILKRTGPNAAKIFHGQMVHRTTCSVCEKETDTAGPFWHLPLELLSENYSVESGIEEFFKTSELSGENQMYCEACKTKVNSTSKYVMKHHPDVLVLLLKRFDFSYRYMSYVKIQCEVDVPYTLTIPQDQTYELYAAVDHFGDLRGGHYAATIKSQDDGRWFTFDGDRVTPLSYNPFPDNKNVAKSSGAYLLFYRKKDSGIDSVDEHTSEDPSSIKDADLQLADKERNTNVKPKRKELVKDGRQERWDSTTTGESKMKKQKQEKRPIKRNNSKEETSKTEKKSMDDPDSDQSESDDPHSQRRKPLNKNPDCDKRLVDQEMQNVKHNVRQKDKKKRLIRSKNQKTDEDPDVSASERRERPTENLAAESGEKKKETIQTNTNRGLEEAADRGHVSEKSKLKVKKITEIKKVIHTDINRKPLIVKTVEEVSFFIEEDRDDRNTDHQSDLNTTNISFPTCSVDQSESLQSGLKDYRGVKLEVPDHNSQKKKTFWDKLREVPEKLQTVQLKR